MSYLENDMSKSKKVKENLNAVRKVQIEQGAYDGRFAPKTYIDKKKRNKNGYKKHKGGK
jgi:hypothetical protein